MRSNPAQGRKTPVEGLGRVGRLWSMGASRQEGEGEDGEGCAPWAHGGVMMNLERKSFNGVPRMARILVFLLLAAALGAQQGGQPVSDTWKVKLVRRVAGEVAARATLEKKGNRVSGRVESESLIVSGRYLLSAGGFIREYDREVRTVKPDALVSKIRLRESPAGYELREETTLGGRTIVLKMPPVSLLLDGDWPEAMIPVLLEKTRGFVRVLDLARGRAELVEIKPRSGGARYLDVPGGGVTFAGSLTAGFERLLAPGPVRMEILPDGNGGVRAEKAPPPGVKEEAVVFRSGDAELHGLLTLPEEPSEGLPGVVLLADAGDRDRDGNTEAAGSGLLRAIAHELARAGYAAIRYDKRGAFRSKGPDEGLAGLVADARAAAAWMAARKEIDPSRIAILGHGEGGWVAARAAADRPDLFRCVISLGAPARELVQALPERLRDRLRKEGLPSASVESEVASLRKQLEELLAQEEDQETPPGRRLLRDLLRIDPVRLYQEVGVPLLILYGSRDALVPRGDRSLLRSTLALVDDLRFSFHEIRDADHEFLQAAGGEGDPESATTDIERPRTPSLMVFIKDHLQRCLAPKKK